MLSVKLAEQLVLWTEDLVKLTKMEIDYFILESKPVVHCAQPIAEQCQECSFHKYSHLHESMLLVTLARNITVLLEIFSTCKCYVVSATYTDIDFAVSMMEIKRKGGSA